MTPLAAPVPDAPARPWNAGLEHLVGALSLELSGQAPHGWACRQYRGLVIGLTVQGDGRKILRISREDRPVGTKAWDRHREELDTLRQHLGIAHWEAEPVADLSTAAWFAEPRVTK